MKRLILLATILATFCLPAKAQFFWGLQFGFYMDGLSDKFSTSSQSIEGGTSFNYMLKPKIGYYISPRLVTGLSLIYTSNSFAENQSGRKDIDFKNYFINILMGNGLDANALSWKVSPYIRYDVFNLFKDKLKFWVELSGYAGAKYPWDAKNKYYLRDESQTIYGFTLHPLISFDIADQWMLFTNLDILSLSWDGATYKTQITVEGGEVITTTTHAGAFLFQCRPTIAIARIFTNIGVIKKF